MTNLEAYIPIVEQAIASFGIDVASCRTDSPTVWSLKRGSANVTMLLNLNQENRAIFVVISGIMEVPDQNREALFLELLTINHTLVGTYFTVYNNSLICLASSRYADGLDPKEVAEMLEAQSYAADALDDMLIAKYGGKRV
ncbi:MAG: YbjN domain-containing protein [Bacteroidia bacterium]|nr:YbjN domain-containing protein [Bacteroidia bacterium]MDW8347457.1 YbjN domain-containing protein [Bacteroidia bacterium]